RLDRLAVQPETGAEVESRDLGSRAALRWGRTRAANDPTRGVRLFFLEPAQARDLSAAMSDAPVLGLDHVVISTGDPQAAAALYGARLGLDLALDPPPPDWGRLMFFRCGDLMVELVQRLGAAADTAFDKLWGLSWRVADLEAARARLLGGGTTGSGKRCGRHAGVFGGRNRGVGNTCRPQAGHEGDDRAGRDLRGAYAVAGEDGEGVI